MFTVLKDKMDSANYNAFLNDYQILYYNKQCDYWKSIHSLKGNSNIFARDLFDRLNNKYNYLEFKDIVVNDKKVHGLIQSLLTTQGIAQAFIMYLHYTTEIYISFMIEYIFKQEIKNNTDIKIISNYKLDVIKKIDLMIGYKPTQIKNYSFISSNYLLDTRLYEYRNCNNLYFIFYTLDIDNINFVEISNNILIHVKDINGFTALIDNKHISLNETIEKIKAAAC